MRTAPRHTTEASFRPRELRDYSEPVIRPAVRLQVRETFWQRLWKALGF